MLKTLRVQKPVRLCAILDLRAKDSNSNSQKEKRFSWQIYKDAHMLCISLGALGKWHQQDITCKIYYTYNDIYCKALAHMIMEAEKSQNLPSAK